MHDSPLFSLVDEPWVGVLTTEGRVEEWSLSRVFAGASDAVRLVGDSPTQAFAVLRLLLAIVHRAINDGPRDHDAWHDLYERGSLPVEEVGNYLDRHRDRFYIGHSTVPFYQVVDLRNSKGEVFGLEKILADVPPNGRLFTARSGAALDRITLSEAARWLIHAQAYDPSGIKTGAVGDPRVKGGKGYPIGTGLTGVLGGVHIEGRTLRETILLNLVPTKPIGLPVWERPPQTAAPDGDPSLGRTPTGLADLYTWQSRRIRLVGDSDGVTGVVLSNGDKLPTHTMFPLEPMTMWRRSPTQEKALKKPVVYMPLKHDPEKSLWRSGEALFPSQRVVSTSEAASRLPSGVVEHLGIQQAEGLEPSARITVRAIGMEYGTQDATTTDIVNDHLTFQAAVIVDSGAQLRALVTNAVGAATDACRAIGRFAADLVRASGGDSDMQEARRDAARESAYSLIDVDFRRWLDGIGADTDHRNATTEWHRTVRTKLMTFAHKMIGACPPSAYRGRHDGSTMYNIARAEQTLYRSLRSVLPAAFDKPTSPEETTHS